MGKSSDQNLFIKKNVVFQLLPYERSREFLQNVPYIEYLEFAVVFSLYFREEHQFRIITKEIQELIGISTLELYEFAKRNTPRLFPLQTLPLHNLYGMWFPDVPKNKSVVIVLSNSSVRYGSSVILYPNVMKTLSNLFGGSFYLLLSSIHECMAVPDNGYTDPKKLRNILLDMNRTDETGDNFLSDHLYYYDADNDDFRVV